jgi:hypothetical protein
MKVLDRLPWPELALSVLAIGLALPLLFPWDGAPKNDDFFLYATQHAIVREALLRHGRLPLETPAVAGGYPTAENPESPVFNPLVALSLVFGEVAGLKLIYVFFSVLCGLGVWWLARLSLGLNATGSFFAAAALLASGLLPGKFVGGNITELPYLTLPLGLHFLLQGRRKIYFRLLVVYGALLALEPKSAPLVVWMFLIACAVLWDVIPPRPNANLATKAPRHEEKRWGFRHPPLTSICLGALSLSLLLSAVKLAPMAGFLAKQGGLRPEILSGHSPRYEETVSCSPLQLLRRLADPSMLVGKTPVNHSVAVGPVIFLAALAALVLSPRLALRLAVPAFLSAWLACGPGARPDLFGVLWRYFPLFNLIDKPGKYFGPPAAIFLCLMAGVAVSAISARFRPRTGRLLAAGLLLVAVPFPLAIHLQCLKSIEYLPADFLPHPLPGGGFYQVENRAGLDRPLDPPHRAAPYYNFKRGVGTIDAWVPVDVPRRAIPRYFIVWPEGLPVPNPAYRGEIEQPAGEPARGEISWEPNRITVVRDRPSSETVVINRNYDPDWRCAEGRVIDHDGRLAVIPSASAGRELRLTYLPRTLLAGAAVSLLTAAAWLILARLKINRE